MKTSVIEVRDMLSVLSLLGVEKRIGAVPGVESVTVSYEAGNATVRYDETRLNIADIKSDVRQRGYQADVPASTSLGDGHESNAARDTPPVTPAPAKPKPAPAAAPQSAVPASDAPKHKSPSDTSPPSSIADAPKSSAAAPVSAAPKSAPAESATPPGSAVSSAEGEKDKAMPHKH